MRGAAVGAPERNQRLPSVQSHSETASGLTKQVAAERPHVFAPRNFKRKSLEILIKLILLFY
jgi:hypothetical protein